MVAVPYCRCRVLYIGSAVPTITKDGLQGIQQPLKERYPTDSETDTKGIDSWLSVWSNGILLEYIDGDKKTETSFHPVNSLHYCAAVRYVNVTGYAIEGGGERFLPLDSPFANSDESPHPPIFAAIFRRTSGIKVLECHAFICTSGKAANALVRCCFHSYAESMYVKLEERMTGLKALKEASRSASPQSERLSSAAEDSPILVEEKDRWAERVIGRDVWERRQQSGEYDSASISSSVANRFTTRKSERSRHRGENGAIVPYNANDGVAKLAGSESDGMYGEHFPGMHSMMPPFARGQFPPSSMTMGPQHMMMRPPMFMQFPPPPHMIPPARPGPHMMPPFIGMPVRFPLGMYPPFPMRMMYPRFAPSYGLPPPNAGRSRSPNEGPIITGPESVYGTLPRRPYEEPIYMTGNGPYTPPQASYQPSNYPSDHYDAYYDTYKKQRSPGKDKSNEPHNSKLATGNLDQDESLAVWENYESSIYRKPHTNEKAFSATIRSMPTMVNDSTRITEADVVRPETPPADYEASFESMHISKPNNQQRTAAVMY